MKNIFKNVIIILSVILISCESIQDRLQKSIKVESEKKSEDGYEQIESRWVWVSSDAGSRRRVREIEDADFKTFSVLDDPSFAIDKEFVYLAGRKIENASSKSFSIIENNGFTSYSKDQNHVFMDNHMIVLADPESFEILEFPYSRDANHIFCGTVPLIMDSNEVHTFIVTNEDKTLSGTKSGVLLSHFIEQYPEYLWLDTLNIKGVIIGEFASGKTHLRKFAGFKEIE